MTPESAIGSLNRGLEQNGWKITLRRQNGPVPFDVEVQAMVRGAAGSDQEGFASEAETIVVISPTEMTSRRWCWPPADGDVIISAGIERTVNNVELVRHAGVLVRINLKVIGYSGGGR